MRKVCVYSDDEHYEEPPEWKPGDYEVRETETCETCGEEIAPHFGEPFATCECGTQEWYK